MINNEHCLLSIMIMNWVFKNQLIDSEIKKSRVPIKDQKQFTIGVPQLGVGSYLDYTFYYTYTFLNENSQLRP